MDSFAALAANWAEWPGYRVMTVMAYGDGLSRRLWSSDATLWPVGGEKILPPDSDLYRTLAARNEPRLVDGADAIRDAFADHDLILGAALGCVLNLPVRQAGRTLGAVNLLHDAGHYVGMDHARLARLADAAAPLMQT